MRFMCGGGSDRNGASLLVQVDSSGSAAATAGQAAVTGIHRGIGMYGDRGSCCVVLAG